jgi:hypothetical protein
VVGGGIGLTFTFDTSGEPAELADWWAETIGWERRWANDELAIINPVGSAPDSEEHILFFRVPEAKVTKNRCHPDVHLPDGVDPDAFVERLVARGATRIDLHDHEPWPVRWAVLADPEGNEFCVLMGQREVDGDG